MPEPVAVASLRAFGVVSVLRALAAHDGECPFDTAGFGALCDLLARDLEPAVACLVEAAER